MIHKALQHARRWKGRRILPICFLYFRFRNVIKILSIRITFLNRNLLIVLYKKAVMCKQRGIHNSHRWVGDNFDPEAESEWYRNQWTTLQESKRQNAEAMDVVNNPGHAWRSGQPLSNDGDESPCLAKLYPAGEYGHSPPPVKNIGRLNTGLDK